MKLVRIFWRSTGRMFRVSCGIRRRAIRTCISEPVSHKGTKKNQRRKEDSKSSLRLRVNFAALREIFFTYSRLPQPPAYLGNWQRSLERISSCRHDPSEYRSH